VGRGMGGAEVEATTSPRSVMVLGWRREGKSRVVRGALTGGGAIGEERSSIVTVVVGAVIGDYSNLFEVHFVRDREP
jgi:hypothetical protein